MTPDERNLLTPGELADLRIIAERVTFDDFPALMLDDFGQREPWLASLNRHEGSRDQSRTTWLNTPLTDEERAR